MRDRNAKQPLDPPTRVAWHQALASIRVRFLRQAITTVGIALGIAFFSLVQVIRTSEPQASLAEVDRYRWLVGTSLVMCLAGVTNSMLMSVAERYREIGTIKCLGASDGFIVRVFFFEALLLGAVGSAIGAVLGTLLAFCIQAIQGRSIPFMNALGILGSGTLIGMTMTVVAAIAPAIQASKMPAAAALRTEV
jgi:predicted lysophospholipase L1 biosynthesis ABC-type transport system permease subunit